MELWPATLGKFRRFWLNFRGRESVWAAACCAVVLLCVIIANPFANSAFNDDYCYSHAALKFAETGRLHYTCGTTMLLPQVLWGAAWIRVFGFSFNVLRVATLPFSLGFVVLVYALGRKTGLQPQLALFGALTVGTSPLFLPLAASFMSDAYGCFFTTLCIYATICSAEARGNSSAMLWLWVLAVSGIVGGSDRQTVWVAPIVLIPYLVWNKRIDRRFTLHAFAAYAVCIASIALVLTKFTQPYAPLEVPRQDMFQFVLHNSSRAFACVTSALLSCSLVSLPAFLCFVPLWKKLGGVRLVAYCLVCAAGVVLLIVDFGAIGLVPFVGNILTASGILLPGQDALGFKPDVLPVFLRIGLTWVLALAVVSFRHLSRTHRGIVGPCPSNNICDVFVPLRSLSSSGRPAGIYVRPLCTAAVPLARYLHPLLTSILCANSPGHCLGVLACICGLRHRDHSRLLRCPSSSYSRR